MTDFRNRELEEQIKIVDVLTGLKAARQIAYQAAKKLPELKPWANKAEHLYREFLAEYPEIKYEPVFDEEAYIQQKIDEGDSVFTEAYGYRVSRSIR